MPQKIGNTKIQKNKSNWYTLTTTGNIAQGKFLIKFKETKETLGEITAVFKSKGKLCVADDINSEFLVLKEPENTTFFLQAFFDNDRIYSGWEYYPG